MVSAAAKIGLVLTAVAGIALAGFAVSRGGGKPGPVTLINGSSSHLITTPTTLRLTASGGTPGGSLIIYIGSTPSTTGASATPGTDHFDTTGTFGPWAYNDYAPGTLYFAVGDVTTGALSNWVEVTVS